MIFTFFLQVFVCLCLFIVLAQSSRARATSDAKMIRKLRDLAKTHRTNKAKAEKLKAKATGVKKKLLEKTTSGTIILDTIKEENIREMEKYLKPVDLTEEGH